MRTTALVLSALLLGVLPQVGVAQARESTAAHLRNDCRLAAQVLTTGQPATHRAWSLERIDLCDISGPVVLAQLWPRVPATQAALQELQVPSARLWDQRIYTALATIARDRSEADLKRIVALQVLSAYAAPRRGMPLSELLDPRPDEVRGVLTTAVDHISYTVGTEALPVTVTSDVARLLRELSEGEPTSAVGTAASRLLRLFPS
jgi:hypothetical protein